MLWNHRLIKRTDGLEVFYSIHEVFYDDRGNPESCTQNAVGVCGESKAEILETLQLMERALSMPTLNYEDF